MPVVWGGVVKGRGVGRSCWIQGGEVGGVGGWVDSVMMVGDRYDVTGTMCWRLK